MASPFLLINLYIELWIISQLVDQRILESSSSTKFEKNQYFIKGKSFDDQEIPFDQPQGLTLGPARSDRNACKEPGIRSNLFEPR